MDKLRETEELGFRTGQKTEIRGVQRKMSLMLEIKRSEECMYGFIKKEKTLRNELPVWLVEAAKVVQSDKGKSMTTVAKRRLKIEEFAESWRIRINRAAFMRCDS